MTIRENRKSDKAQGLQPTRVKDALLHGDTIEARGWMMRINDNDEVEIWPPSSYGDGDGTGFSTHLGRLDIEVQNFCKAADMPIPGVNEEQGPAKERSDPELGEDTSVKKPKNFEPGINDTTSGLDQKGTEAPNTSLGPDSDSRTPRNFDPAVNKRPKPSIETGGLPNTDLGTDTDGNDTKWGGRNRKRAVQIPMDEVEFSVVMKPELDIPDEGDFDDPTAIKQIEKQLERGNEWAWCQIQVIATWNVDGQTITGESFWLIKCSYKSEENFKQSGDYYEDMMDDAYKNLLVNAEDTDVGMRGLRPRSEGRQAENNADPFNVKVVEEPGKILNTGENPSDPDDVIKQVDTDSSDDKGEKEGRYQRIRDTYADQTPDPTSIYRELRRARPSQTLLEDIMDSDKWVANNIFTPGRSADVPKEWEKTVEDMKEHPEIDNPFALAKSMGDKGYTPGGKKSRKQAYNFEKVLRTMEERISTTDLSEEDERGLQKLLGDTYDMLDAGNEQGAHETMSNIVERFVTLGISTRFNARRQAGPKLREKWHNDGGYGRDIEAESAEELHALTRAFGGDEVDWSPFKPNVETPEGSQDVTDTAGDEVVARKQAAFMEPMVVQDEWAYIEDEYGDGRWVESKYKDDAAIIGDGKITKIEEGWGAQMSAPGYLDQTGWEIFDTEDEAWDHLFENYMDDMGELDEEYEEYRDIYEDWQRRMGRKRSQYDDEYSQTNAEELAEAWINGNKSHVMDEIRSADDSVSLFAEIQQILGEDDAQAFISYWMNAKRSYKSAQVGGDKDAVDPAAQDYWSGYMGEYGKKLTEDGDVTKGRGKDRDKDKDKGKKRDKDTDKKGRVQRRQAWLRARHNAQAQAPMAQPTQPAPATPAPTPTPTAPAPGAAQEGQPPQAPKAPGAEGDMAPGTGDAGLQALGWTAEDINLLDPEDKKKILEIKLNKPGTKVKAPAKPGDKPVTPETPVPVPGAPTPGTGAEAPAPGTKPVAPVAPVAPAVARRMAQLIYRKINRRRVLAQAQGQQPVPAPQPAAPAPVPTTPAGEATLPEFGGQPTNETAISSAEERAFQILSEIQQAPITASTPDQVTSVKSSQLARQLLTELGMTAKEARDLFGVRSFSSLFK